MLDDEEEWIVYRSVHQGYFNCTPRHNYASWARTHAKDRKNFPIIARGLTETQAMTMVDLTREEK